MRETQSYESKNSNERLVFIARSLSNRCIYMYISSELFWVLRTYCCKVKVWRFVCVVFFVQEKFADQKNSVCSLICFASLPGKWLLQLL